MKKIIYKAFLMMLVILLVSCSNGEQETKCVHNWKEKTCKAPRTCSVCGETQGDIGSDHNYLNDICQDCGLIQLTLDNYEDYIECKATVKGESVARYGGSIGHIYRGAECNFEAIGNSHYKYNDVVIVVKFSHYDRAGWWQYRTNELALVSGQPIEKEAIPYDDRTCTIKLNLAGNANEHCSLTTPWTAEYGDLDVILTRTTYEFISITGTVEEYK